MDSPIPDVVVAEWPAVLAALVLVGGHLFFVFVLNEGIQPLGVPLLVAIAVFILAEVGRALL